MEPYLKALSKVKSNKGASVYLCLVKNRFFLDKFIKELKEVLFKNGFSDFNYEALDGNSKKVSEIIDCANQLPAFSTQRLVVVENFKQPKGADADRFISYANSPSPATVLVVIMKDAKITAKFSKDLGKEVETIEFKDPYEKQLPHWVGEIAKGYGKNIDPGVCEYFVNFVGNDLERIDSEISKLVSYIGDKRSIAVKDLEEMVSDTKVETIFSFIDSLSGKNLKQGLRMLAKMIRAGELPVRIISMLSRHYRILWKVKKGIRAGIRGKNLSLACGVNPYFLNKYVEHSENFTFASLARVIGLLAKADIEVKSIRISKKILLEKLCLDLASL